MSDVINIEEYRKKIADSALESMPDIPSEDKEAINKIASSIAEKYIKQLNKIDHSFSLQVDPAQAKLVQDKINVLRNDLNEIIIGLVQEVAEKSARLYFLEKHR